MSDSSSYWDGFDKAVEKEFGGGGVIARVRIETGFKVYAGGKYGDQCFFATRFGDAHEVEKNTALEKARELGRPQPGTQIKMFREGAISRGKLATWNVDQFENVAQYAKGFKEVLRPSLVANGIDAPWEGYARIGWKDDPHFTAMGDEGKKEEDQAGEPRFPRVAYVVAVLTAQEYQAVLAEASGGDAQADVLAAFDGELPSGLKVPKIFGDSRDTWESTVMEIAEKIGAGPDPVRLAHITNALTVGTDNYLGYDEAGLGASPVQVLAWMNHLGV